jgi:two-component system cell cycle sensor histidine kinase/response regulator CckA
MQSQSKKLALAISLSYGLMASLWILTSDALVTWWLADAAGTQKWQTIKGLSFVIGTAGLLFLIIYFFLRKLDVERRERNAVMTALRERETLLAHALKIARMGSWTADLRAGTVTASPEGAAMVGWQPGVHPLTELFALVHPEDQERVQKAWAATSAGSAYTVEHRLLVGGKLRWVDVRGEVERDEQGHPVRVIGITQDVTERKRAEQQFAALVNNIDGIVWEVDLTSGATTIISDQVQRILGFRAEAWLVQKNFWNEHIHPEDREWVQAYGREKRQSGASYDYEYRMISATGQAVWIHDYVSVVLGAGNKPVTLRGVMVDVTQRHQAEAEVRRREQRFRLLIENASDIVTVLNAAGLIRFQSPSVVHLLGYQVEEMTDRNAFEFVHPDDAARIATAIKRAHANPGLPVTVEYRLRHSDGTWRYLQSVGRSIPGEAPEGFIVVNSRDITETRKLEEQFRQAQKMEAIGQLAGGVAHDLNNILTVIQMQVDLLKHGDPLTPQQSESILDVEKVSRRAADLTRQLLMFSRRQAALKQNLDLNNVITNITKMLQRILGEDVTILIRYAPQPLPIFADAGMLDQILLNLAVNSRDAMPTGGKLTIETTVTELDEFAATQQAQARPGKFACLSVNDTGRGIPAEILPRIFEPFFTTKDVGKGTGLGLATVFGIVQQHKGWINVSSEVNCGTSFQLYFPLVRETSESHTERFPATLPGGTETILLVEDEQSLRVLVRNVLTRLGYHVLEATTGHAALEVWREHQAEIRLLLTDLVMPDGMTGKQLAEELLRQNPRLPVIYCSGYSRETVGLDFPLQEGINFLSKPFQAAKLAAGVRQQLDSAQARH